MALYKSGQYSINPSAVTNYYYYYPGTQFPGNEKNYAMQYKKYKNQTGMNLTPPPPPPPPQNSLAVGWHCTAESEGRVAEIKS